jgi:hypothetical protein
VTRTGEARAFGNALLTVLYREMGGDGERTVRLDSRKAAQICTGATYPADIDQKYLRELLHQLARLDLHAFRVQPDADLEGTFLIQPRRRASSRLSEEAHA